MTPFVRSLLWLETIAGQIGKEEISGIFDNDLLFEEMCEILKQQSWVEGCHMIFQASNFPVTSRLTFHVLRITSPSKYIPLTHLDESGRCVASAHIRYRR